MEEKKFWSGPASELGEKHNHRFLTCVKRWVWKCVSCGKFAPAYSRYTLQGINISPKNGILMMIFLFLRWDMLVPWRVYLLSSYSKQAFWSEFWKNRIWGWDNFHLTPKNWPKPKKAAGSSAKTIIFQGAVSVVTKEFSMLNFQELETYLSKRQPFNPKGVLWKAVYTICMHIYIWNFISFHQSLYMQNNALWWKDRWRSPLPKGGE